MKNNFLIDEKKIIKAKSNGSANKLHNIDLPFHDWYRFVLSFPAHIVREYISKCGVNNNGVIFDPFCGTGTTLVEAKLLGINGVGIEANPIAHFASSVKTDWLVDPDGLVAHANMIAIKAKNKTGNSKNLLSLPLDSFNLLLTNSISPLPLHKTLILIDEIESLKDEIFYKYELLALAKTIVFHASNLRFGPEVGVSRKKKNDHPVIESWLTEIENMANDLRNKQSDNQSNIKIYNGDSREIPKFLEKESIDMVFTSPPYPNEKDYTRTTRLESVLLGFIRNKDDLRELKKGLLRSNTRNVYKGDNDDMWVEDHDTIQKISDEIEKRRIDLNKTSGFEKLYHKVAKLYFGGMTRHLSTLRPFLKKDAYLGYVVGDQASYLRVVIRTGELLADIAKSLGYKVESIDLFRTRFATATRENMREEVVVLRWPGF